MKRLIRVSNRSLTRWLDIYLVVLIVVRATVAISNDDSMVAGEGGNQNGEKSEAASLSRDMILVPGGQNSGNDPDFEPYMLMCDSFYLDRTEVTKGLWDEVYLWAIAHGYDFEYDWWGSFLCVELSSDQPIVFRSWYDGVKWCNARSEKDNLPVCYRVSGNVYRHGEIDDVTCATNLAGYRLPTSAEWEYAARGGLVAKRFPWGDVIDHSCANYKSYWATGMPCRSYDEGYEGEDTHCGTNLVTCTLPVGSYGTNGYGVCDIIGNVWEWCWDSSLDGTDILRVVRGGSCLSGASHCRVGFRLNLWPDMLCRNVGFRTARSYRP